MKNIKLFESFSFSRDLENMASKLESDPKFSGWEFQIDDTNKIPFLIWLNPADSQEWQESGYAEDYDGDFSDVQPMPILAFVEIFGQLFAYRLTPEEKYSGTVIVVDDQGLFDQLQMINSVEDLKDAVNESVWGMD